MTLATACNSLAAAAQPTSIHAGIMNNSLAAAAQLIELHQYCSYHENYKLTYILIYFSHLKKCSGHAAPTPLYIHITTHIPG